ncbi:hypothetical protein CF150_15158 [Pseudomonas sp. CF150]|jgi:hypothetical protein|nr:hypothetical protein CF150_15158 [Pseudomonas sp. CF150]
MPVGKQFQACEETAIAANAKVNALNKSWRTVNLFSDLLTTVVNK